MGFLSQGVPNLVPGLFFRAWRGGRWDFRLWPFFRSVFWFLHWKTLTSVFRLWCPLQLLVFRFFSFRVFGKNKARYWFLCAMSLCSQMLSYFYDSILQSIRVNSCNWGSGFLFEVYSSLCQALGQCRWAKKANEKRKKHESSENKVTLSPHLSRSFLTFFSIRFPHYLGFTAIESFLRTQNCPYCPLLLFNRGSLWILLDNPRADMPVLRPYHHSNTIHR